MSRTHGMHLQEIPGEITPEIKRHMGGYADVWLGMWKPPGEKARAVSL